MNTLVSLRSLATALFDRFHVAARRGAIRCRQGQDRPGTDPVNLDITGLFQAKFASVGSDLFIAGQPTEKALRDLKAKGVTTVINLRMPEEMKQIGFDEAALVERARHELRAHPHARIRRESLRPEATRSIRRGDGISRWESVVALHGGVARQPHLGSIPDSRSRACRCRRRSRRPAASTCETRRRSADSSRSKGSSGGRFPELAKPKQ